MVAGWMKIGRKEDFYDTKPPAQVGLREEIMAEDIRVGKSLNIPRGLQ
jgi:hypothetical protein